MVWWYLLSCPGSLAHPRTRCQAQGVMQGALSTSTQAACSGPTNGRRESGCLPGQCKADRMAALARTRLQVLVVVASPKLTRACVSRSDSRLLGNAGGSPTLSSSSFETPENLHVGVVKGPAPRILHSPKEGQRWYTCSGMRGVRSTGTLC